MHLDLNVTHRMLPITMMMMATTMALMIMMNRYYAAAVIGPHVVVGIGIQRNRASGQVVPTLR